MNQKKSPGKKNLKSAVFVQIPTLQLSEEKFHANSAKQIHVPNVSSNIY